MDEPIIARRSFEVGDQEAFARLSGDFNPLHMDPVAARRTLVGAPAVHGVHGLLWALEALAKDDAAFEFRFLKARFLKFLPIGQEVSLHARQAVNGGLRLELRLDGMIATTIDFLDAGEALGLPNPTALPERPPSPHPQERSFEADEHVAEWILPPDPGHLPGQLFPALTARLGADHVAAIAQCSAVVGMECPGLHSIFLDLEIRRYEFGGRRGVGYRATQPDARYPRLRLDLAAATLSGRATVLIRPAPVRAPAMAELAHLGLADAFAGRRAVVIGGSRGLGAVAAKMLALGGGKVCLTFNAGPTDAEAVLADIGSVVQGAARSVQFDVRTSPGPELLAALETATDLLYFATPHIQRQGADLYSPDTFRTFHDIYVDGFDRICRELLRVTGQEKIRILYPSTVYVEKRPRGMLEYAMAKAAGELLCEEMRRSHSHLRILAPRLPRLRTDQTASALPIQVDEPVEPILKVLRVLSEL